jgi:hypothetical protein
VQELRADKKRLEELLSLKEKELLQVQKNIEQHQKKNKDCVRQLEAKIERQEKLYKDQIRQLKDDMEDIKANHSARPHKVSSRNLSENKESQSVERLDGLRRMQEGEKQALLEALDKTNLQKTHQRNQSNKMAPNSFIMNTSASLTSEKFKSLKQKKPTD